MRHRIRFAPAQTPHVAEECALLAPSQLAPADLVPRGALQDRLIDVRHVLGVTHPLATGLEHARQDVENDERARMTEVRGVVGRDAADGHGRGMYSRLEGEGAAPPRVVEP